MTLAGEREEIEVNPEDDGPQADRFPPNLGRSRASAGAKSGLAGSHPMSDIRHDRVSAPTRETGTGC